MLQDDAVRPVDYDPFAFEVMRNPLPFYKELRDRYPVYYIERYDAFAFSRFADVMAMYDSEARFHTQEGTLVDKTAIAERRRGLPAPMAYDPLPIIGAIQPPYYEEIRQAIGRRLRPRSVAALEADVRARTRALLDALVPRGGFDVVKEFAGIVASGTVCRMCGIPVERAAEVLAAVNFATAQDPVKGGFPPNWQENRERLLSICREAVADRLAGDIPDGDNPIDGLADYRLDGRALKPGEIAMVISSIVLGGSETLPKVIACGLMELERQPEARREILSDLPTNSAIAFEEMLRFCAPAQWFMRTVREAVTIAGQRIEPGQRVLALIASANRDEREFENPDTFVWNREIRRQLSFGQGLHFCIGVHLARLEGRVIIEELLARMPDYRITDAVRTPSSFQWGYTSATITKQDIPA